MHNPLSRILLEKLTGIMIYIYMFIIRLVYIYIYIYIVRSESRRALSLRYVDLVFSIEARFMS
jgi:hypothetical protein